MLDNDDKESQIFNRDKLWSDSRIHRNILESINRGIK